MGQLCVSKQSTDTAEERLEAVKEKEPAEEVVVFTEEKPVNGSTKQEEPRLADKEPLIKAAEPPDNTVLAAKQETTTKEPQAKKDQEQKTTPTADEKEKAAPPKTASEQQKQPPPAKEPPKLKPATPPAAAAASKEPAKKKQPAAKKEEVKKKQPVAKEPKKEQKKEKAVKPKKASAPFISLVDASKRVALESCSSAKRVFTGVVQVYNLAYVKDVLIRFTFDGWSTQQDVQAEYIDSHQEVSTDRFKFEIPRESNRPVEFAIAYSVDGCQYWDNNNEKNYVFK